MSEKELSISKIKEWLDGYASDPTWSDHAEVPKSLLRAASAALSPSPERQTNEMGGTQMFTVCHKCQR